MSAPSAAAAAAMAGAKRKRDPDPMLAPAASPSATAATSSSSDSEPKRARLVAVPLTAADVAHFEEQQATARAAAARALPASSSSAAAAAASLVGWKGARILVDTSLEVLSGGHVLVHMSVCFDGVSRRLARKQGRLDATAAKHREKKVAQKHKQKAKRHEAQQQKKALSAQMTAEGKTDEQIRTYFRDKYNNSATAASGSRSAKLHRSWLLAQMQSNVLQKVVIDCSFDALMKLEEVCSLAKQIKYIYGHNLRSPKPMHLILSSLGQPHEGFEAADVWKAGPSAAAAASALASGPAAAIAAAVAAVGGDTDMKDVAAAAASTVAASSAAAQPAASSSSSSAAPSAAYPAMYLRSLLSRLDGFDRLAFDRFEEHFTALPSRLGIDRSSLVYLTAESPTVLHKLDPSKTYVIGGIVDHNRMKGLCHSLAVRSGLSTARLPIQEHLVNHRRTVITVNQVFEILMHAQEGTPDAKVDWTAILKEVLPARSGWKERENKDSKTSSNGNKAAAEDDEEEDEKQQEQEDDDRNQRLEKLQQAEAEPEEEGAAGDEDADEAEACTDV